MQTNIFVQGLVGSKEYEQIKYSLEKNLSPTMIHGLLDSQIAHIVFALNQSAHKQCLIVTYNAYQSKKIYEDLKLFMKNKNYQYPAAELVFYNYDAYSHQGLEERLNTTIQMAKGEKCIVVASIDSLLYKKMPKAYFCENFTKLSYGETVELEKIVNNFILSGYERVDMVEAKGQFSIRGGIIDFFPVTSENPYRIELFDNEIDSIRSFDIYSQLSLEKLREVDVYPAKEILFYGKLKKKAIEKIKQDLQKHAKKLKGESLTRLKENLNLFIEELENQNYPKGFENYLNYYYEKLEDLIDYLEEDALVFMDEPSRVKERADTAFKEIGQTFKGLLEKGEVLPSQINLMLDYETFLLKIKKRHVFALSSLPKNNPSFTPKHIVNFSSRMAQTFHGKIDLFAAELKNFKYRGYKTILLCGTKERAKRLEESLKEEKIECNYLQNMDEKIQSGQIFILQGNLMKGFEYISNKFLVIAENEIFGTYKKKKVNKRRKDGRPIKSFMDLKVGDYVVHENHGVGKYIGVEQLKLERAKKDYLKLKYSGADLLYVPIEQMDLVQKYIGSDGGTTKLNKLGGTEWKKTKAKVKGAIVDMAKELLRLNAIRQTTKGYVFGKDTPWQAQFEDDFPYEETPDQIRCIKELKEDMERSVPMDRLLCGDVGYGKTEVAIRGVFKCVMEGKQAAILVPTTILAQQHYNTFMQRFAQFPITIEMLSRFKTEKEQNEILKKARAGAVDILIGTHRIISKDVTFKDLGLLIIDEEQRFGVQHKESLKQLRKNVDVLTLTATPIPRTLHMSLIGLRDMSVIEDPPEERYPVQTYVLEYNDEIISDAIIKEMSRGGQVYFVFNRVKGIEQMASKIRKLVPEAKIAVGHGQMSERELENIMLDFMNGEYDILICTTIIETGLDISNVNTIIIYDSDKMGLSQLYQLRGRVGRSNRLAYAYLTYQKDKILTEIAEKRLKAIKEFTEFGSGFKIAMRDLEIRGAGNLLGSQQHGHMAAIGYDLYCKLLEDTVREMKGEKIEEIIETSIEIHINAFIPAKYIVNETHRLEIYKKMASIRDGQDVYDLEEEIEDRFGNLPEAVMNLISIAYIKAMAQNLGVVRITETKTHAKLEFDKANRMNPMVISEVIAFYGKRIQVSVGINPHITLKYYFENQRIKEIRGCLEKISGSNK
ncbi:transcription-repair coupling factor [Marinisporobacter balticus]|uniref:Transcription-repair-coupling factor n=1 Tax=Marinisporobacter balticus TaxID=2018667 RepID=A0A4R2KL05_9FIRM|nr:transcription-repair coupling factor [Marinisporobacter balticus]TCO71369.1 transcription-repair coupling factor [Marinisporobacter balticus]